MLNYNTKLFKSKDEQRRLLFSSFYGTKKFSFSPKKGVNISQQIWKFPKKKFIDLQQMFHLIIPVVDGYQGDNPYQH